MDRYDREPRPEVERHHHIRELMDQQDRRVLDREAHRAHESARTDRQRELAGIERRAVMDFWCQPCRLDFKAESIREDERDWGDPNETVSFYRAKCFRGHRAIRLALDKLRDPYWERSRAVAADRGSHAADILQPFESGYDMLYRHKTNNR